MADLSALVQQGVNAIKAGRKDEARRILSQVVEQDETNEQAWLWLSAVVDSPAEQQLCLENVLALNPGNEKARKGLAVLTKTMGKTNSSATPPARPQENVNNYNSGADSSSNSGFDEPDPYVSNSSVDWGRKGNAAPAYGSGKDVPLPSADELDNWVSGLSIGGSQSGSGNSFKSDFNSGYGSNSGSSASPFDDVADPFSSRPQADPFGGSGSSSFDDYDTANLFGSEDLTAGTGFGDQPFGTSSAYDAADPFGPPSSKPNLPSPRSDYENMPSSGRFNFRSSPGSNTFATPVEDDMFADSSFGGSAFGGSSSSFDSGFGSSTSTNTDDIFANLPGPSKSPDPFGAKKSNAFGANSSPVRQSPSGGFAFIDNSAPMMANKQAYFKAIPSEIQAGGVRRKLDIKLALTVGGLALLNMVSFAMLLLNLIKR